jgi:uncharacterized protein (DUF433 family)
MAPKAINIDPQILSGTPVFNGTRIPVEVLFDYLETGLTIDEFITDYPAVKKKQVIQVLEIAEKLLVSNNPKGLNETAA